VAKGTRPAKGSGGLERIARFLDKGARERWLLLLDAAILALVILMLTVEDAGELFLFHEVFFVLTIGAFFWPLRSLVVRGAFWALLTTVVLAGAVWAGRVPALELLDVPFFVVVVVLVFAVSKSRAEAREEVERLLVEEQDRGRRLSELAELKADFTAMVVHEVGNPISALRRLTEMLRFEDLDREDKEYVLDSIRGELSTLDALVADTQAAVVVEREDFRIEMRPVPLRELLQEAEKYGHSVARGDSFRVVAKGLPERREVVADPERIAQVLRNLLLNATKYSSEGSPIELRTKPGEPGRVRIEVADEGQGISPEDLDRVFEKFDRGRDGDAGGGKVPGAGLGLYISRRLLRAHGSELSVSSKPDAGSVFGFELRLAREGEGEGA
jgi:signal transduction histidine kinase